MTKKIFIIQSNYIPWKGYFDAINMADVFVVYDEVQYTKNDWRNRNVIKTPTGQAWLTIPVRQLSLQQKISETEIATHNWNVKHWNSLKANYAKAAYFKEFEDYFQSIYLDVQSNKLSEVNLTFIKTINKILGIETEIIDSVELEAKGDKNERLVDMILKLNGNHYISGQAAQSYLDVALFQQHGIAVEWLDYSAYPEYQQLFPPFTHAVTILDLIFNEGANAVKYMKSFGYAK